MSDKILSIKDHRRDRAGLLYVYPVLSRRAGGISLGINLNPNARCNWRCIYCQVANLSRGAAPTIDVPKLIQEVAVLLARIRAGEFSLPGKLKDLAISGDGEPTTAAEFANVIYSLGEFIVLEKLKVPLRLITNGSQLHRKNVQEGLRILARLKGEVWFKVDGGSVASMARINDVKGRPEDVIHKLNTCAALCATWVQSCFFKLDGIGPAAEDVEEYLKLLQAADHKRLKGVLLYSVVRPSQQPEAPRLAAMTTAELAPIARKIRALGLKVKVTP